MVTSDGKFGNVENLDKKREIIQVNFLFFGESCAFLFIFLHPLLSTILDDVLLEAMIKSCSGPLLCLGFSPLFSPRKEKTLLYYTIEDIFCTRFFE